MSADAQDSDETARAKAWLHRMQASICDVQEPWAYGTTVRSSRYPDYWDYNVMRVEREPALDCDELIAIADLALAGLAHRRIDFELVGPADQIRAAMGERGFISSRLLWMRHDGSPQRSDGAEVEQLDYDVVAPLRLRWNAEGPGYGDATFFSQAREVALGSDTRVFCVREEGEPVAFAQLICSGQDAEISDVYVVPERRSSGLGTAVTRAAILAAGRVRDLWIIADDEDRPKELYARLGFAPIWRAVEFLRAPRV